MNQPRRYPTSPYLRRRLRSYEEAHADRQGPSDGGLSDVQHDERQHDRRGHESDAEGKGD